MGKRNYLIEGVTCSGKSSVYRELKERGYTAVDGDNELAYQGNPETGRPIPGIRHEHHIWNLKELDQFLNNDEEIVFFCGGSRNFPKFIDRFDKVFVLDIDEKTLIKRLDSRKKDDWGNTASQRELVIRLNRTKEDIPSQGVSIDATKPLDEVVDSILDQV